MGNKTQNKRLQLRPKVSEYGSEQSHLGSFEADKAPFLIANYCETLHALNQEADYSQTELWQTAFPHNFYQLHIVMLSQEREKIFGARKINPIRLSLHFKLASLPPTFLN